MRLFFCFFILILFPSSVFAIDNADVWKPYLQKIEKDIKASWYNAQGLNRHNKECKINLFFNIKNTGDISNAKILASDCPENMNKLALQVVNNSSPLEPFPDKISGINEISIDFIFDYNLLPENKKDMKLADKPLHKSYVNSQVSTNISDEILVKQDIKKNSNKISIKKIVYIVGFFAFLFLLTCGFIFYKRNK